MTYGVSPFSSPREPHVRPVAGFPGQSDLRPAPSASAAPATGASVGTTWRKRITSYLKSPWTVQNGRASAAPRRLDRGAAPTGDGHDLVHMREVVFVPVTGHHDYSGKERRHDAPVGDLPEHLLRFWLPAQKRVRLVEPLPQINPDVRVPPVQFPDPTVRCVGR